VFAHIVFKDCGSRWHYRLVFCLLSSSRMIRDSSLAFAAVWFMVVDPSDVLLLRLIQLSLLLFHPLCFLSRCRVPGCNLSAPPGRRSASQFRC
jgi:hypothetical protein